MEFSRQEYWSGYPFTSLGDLLDPRIEPQSLVSPALQADSLTAFPLRKLFFLPSQVTPKYSIDNPCPCIFSAFTSLLHAVRWVMSARLLLLKWKETDFHVPHTKGQSTLCFLFLFPDISALLGASLAYWLTHQLLGCTSQTCKPCSYPAPRTMSPEIETEISMVIRKGILQV